ncbi:hypothetical protein AAHC03_05249 [Spirometra sp. Aus1]|nr:unnamed protein product [Spirometra erinaceieuropaei]
MPMFKVPWKPSPVSPDISSIKKKVRARYGEQMHIDEQLFTSFLQLRTNSCRPPIDVSSISKIRRYYAQLMLLKNRINLSEPKFVHWPWQDALVESSFVRDEAEYEEAATLYNLGSAHSIVGEQESRADDDSLKQACTQFQCAAWVFQTLRERYAQFENANDMHGDLCRFYHSLMLGQAQECVTEKSMLDGRPPIVTAKLTKFLTESYDYCWNQLNAQTLASLLPEKFLREWKRLVLVKKLAFSALSNYFLAMDAATKMKFGPGVTWLKQADTDITQAVKVAKEASNASNSPRFGAPLLAVVTFAQNVISARRVCHVVFCRPGSAVS